jgi:succinyl-CoA synthetase alpha subunit
MNAFINTLRDQSLKVVSLGSHPGIIQSMLDYDYLIGKQAPSVTAIIATGKKQERYFWGESEVTIPVYADAESLPGKTISECAIVLNVLSARRVFSSTERALETFPNLQLVSIFAEQTPELHATKLIALSKQKNVLIVGPSSVGVLLPGFLKVGPIGGTQHHQLVSAGILSAGDTAVVSTSGGMVNELIHAVTNAELGVSMAVAVGGDRFAITTPLDVLLMAEKDPRTERIVYFGELGGSDEAEIVAAIQSKKITKTIHAYIAGEVADLFETPPQFGHAKAFAGSVAESAKAKKQLLREVGVEVYDSFMGIEEALRALHLTKHVEKTATIGSREKAMIVSHISGEENGVVNLLGSPLVETIQRNTLPSLIISMLLGTQVKSQRLIDFTDHVLKLLVDHGPQVSGAMNTIVAARAGKDLVSSLSAGLLTVGPRFGGAINASAAGWIEARAGALSAPEFVEAHAKSGIPISGIGHKKYTRDSPDPRVKSLMEFAGNKNGDAYVTLALAVEKSTTAKKENLILNVDGAVAALALDIFESELGYTQAQLQELVDTEFFNALFVLSRSVGFVSHFLDQKRNDEGLFRLPVEDVRYIDS